MVEVRDATVADAWQIASVHVESWQVGYRGLLPDDVLAGLSVGTRERWWQETLAAPGTRSTLLAVEGADVLGFAAVGADRSGDPRSGELYAIYLRPRAWSRGIGSALHTAACTRLRSSGYDRASLWMLAGNERALRFYRREGWTDDGRSKLVTGADGVEMDHRGMSRSLTGP